MSYHDYKVSQFLSSGDVPFYGVIMTAMQLAHSSNMQLLANAWPEVWAELKTRYAAPGGVVPSDPLFLCPRCSKVSANPDDTANGYCGECHESTREGSFDEPE